MKRAPNALTFNTRSSAPTPRKVSFAQKFIFILSTSKFDISISRQTAISIVFCPHIAQRITHYDEQRRHWTFCFCKKRKKKKNDWRNSTSSIMLVPGHVCSFYLATGGANGPALGSDEKEIVMLEYNVIDVLTNEVSPSMSFYFFSSPIVITVGNCLIRQTFWHKICTYHWLWHRLFQSVELQRKAVSYHMLMVYAESEFHRFKSVHLWLRVGIQTIVHHVPIVQSAAAAMKSNVFPYIIWVDSFIHFYQQFTEHKLHKRLEYRALPSSSSSSSSLIHQFYSSILFILNLHSII